MRIASLIILTLSLLPVSGAHAQNPQSAFSLGGLFGYRSGPSGQVFVVAQDFAEGLPVHIRVGLGRSSTEPGSAAAARRIFINNATNGTPVERGGTLDMSVDALWPLGTRSFVFAGVRHTRFKANFKYVGGNEDFDVTSSHWGAGLGLEARYPMGGRTDLVVAGGGEYFLPSRLTGHDTSYAQDGDDVNPREKYTYADADEAVGQPVWRPVLAVGFSYRLGSE